MAVNSSAVSSSEQGRIKALDERKGCCWLSPYEESGQLLDSQSKMFTAEGRHILNVIIHHWALIALLGHEIRVFFVIAVAWSQSDRYLLTTIKTLFKQQKLIHSTGSVVYGEAGQHNSSVYSAKSYTVRYADVTEAECLRKPWLH